MATCLWDAISKLHDKLELETTEWIERRKENEKNTGTDHVTGQPIAPNKEISTMSSAHIDANRKAIFELAMMLVQFEDERKCCSNCKWRYIKDYTFGTCDNTKTTAGRIEPDGYCDFFEKRK